MNTQNHRLISRGFWIAAGECVRHGGVCSGARPSKRQATTQHQTLDQEAERTRIQAGIEAVVLGQNVGSVGAQVSGKTLTQIEGADQTKLYDVPARR